MVAVARPPRGAGTLLRTWRQRRRLSQLDLALRAEVSPRHLSFVETGRSSPSRELLLHLAEHLDVPLRERNTLLLAAGYAPTYPQAPLDSPVLTPVREALGRLLDAHLPYPALVVDRAWNLVLANDTALRLVEGSDPALLEPPVNVLRLSLHPRGMAPRIANLAQFGEHVLARLRRQVDFTGDETVAALHSELSGYLADHTGHSAGDAGHEEPQVVVPFVIDVGGHRLRLFTTIATFGAPLDVTVSELAIEAFYPADPETAAALGAF